MINDNTWGNFVTNKRIDAGLTLRKFCLELEHDCGNWSKMERGILLPPKFNAQFYDKLGKLLNLSIEETLHLTELAGWARQPLLKKINKLERENLLLIDALMEIKILSISDNNAEYSSLRIDQAFKDIESVK